MKVASVFVVGASAATFEEIAETINSGNHGWTAQAPSKFANSDEATAYLGAFVPGDEKFEEPTVVELPPMNSELPAEFDSLTQWPQCSVIGNVRDQSSCGSCWAFASVSSFESRLCILTPGEPLNMRDVKYSPEDTAFCSDAGDGCNGGFSAWNWFVKVGVVTGGDYYDKGADSVSKLSTCFPYSLAPCAHHVPATDKYPACPAEVESPKYCLQKDVLAGLCPADVKASCSCSDDHYYENYTGDKVSASAAYSVRGVEQIMQDLYTNGPMYVSLTVYEDFPTYKSGVYTHQTGSALGGHAMTLVGYGTLDGTDYWKIKNSWNEEWGLGGHILIKRGSNECGIEGNVNAGTHIFEPVKAVSIVVV